MTDDEDLTSVPPDDEPETVRSALTADEWRSALRYEELGGSVRSLDGVFGEASTREAQHYIAALALYGQPFGFTHAMLEALRAGIRSSDWYDRDSPSGYIGDRVVDGQELERLAEMAIERIAALLPPANVDEPRS